jgi:hypothetical protein
LKGDPGLANRFGTDLDASQQIPLADHSDERTFVGNDE